MRIRILFQKFEGTRTFGPGNRRNWFQNAVIENINFSHYGQYRMSDELF
jgi:hypothetical protein